MAASFRLNDRTQHESVWTDPTEQFFQKNKESVQKLMLYIVSKQNKLLEKCPHS